MHPRPSSSIITLFPCFPRTSLAPHLPTSPHPPSTHLFQKRIPTPLHNRRAPLRINKQTLTLIHIGDLNPRPPRHTTQYHRGRQQLQRIPETRPHAPRRQPIDRRILNINPLRLGADAHNRAYVRQVVGVGRHDEQAAEEVRGHAMGGRDVGGAADGAYTAVRGEDDDWRDLGLERAVEVCEALDVEHVHLVDEEDAGDELGDALVNVLFDDLVDLGAQLVGDLGLLGLHELAHHGHDVLAALGARVGHVEVVQRHVLHDLLLLVHLALGDGHVFFGLEVELGGVGVAAADALDGAGVGFDVDYVAGGDALFLDAFVDARVEAELFGALAALEADDDVGDGFAVAAERVFGFFGGEVGDFAFVDFFGFFDAEACGVGGVLEGCLIVWYMRGGDTNGPPKVLHQRLRLLDFSRVDLAAHDRAERHLCAQLLRDCECERGLSCPGPAGEEHGAPRHLFGLD